MKRFSPFVSLLFLACFIASGCAGLRPSERKTPEQVHQEKKVFAERFKWWPTDAKPAPYEDPVKGGYWWWPDVPGEVRPYGNRGYVFIRKIIFDDQGRPHLLVKRIVRNVKIYFDFDKSDLRQDTLPTLTDAVNVLKKDSSLTTLLTGNADVRGSESYNQKLAANRAESVLGFLAENGIAQDRIKILSRGKLDAVAPVTDLVGMQKDRNVHFMVAEVEEIQVPDSQLNELKEKSPGQPILEEVKNIETPVRVRVKEYVVQKNDSLWKIAKKVYGDGNQWRRLYQYNRKRIPNPKTLQPGQVLEVPIE